jgi:hypothetical protein
MLILPPLFFISPRLSSPLSLITGFRCFDIFIYFHIDSLRQPAPLLSFFFDTPSAAAIADYFFASFSRRRLMPISFSH